MIILGISAYYHDSAAAIIKDGIIIAAAQEERFTRKKHDPSFPINAIMYCLKEAKTSISKLHNIAFYDKPFIKFERILETYMTEAPFGLYSFIEAMPIWLKEKLFLKNTLIKELKKITALKTQELANKLLFSEHHLAHAASAFFPSPYNEAAILTVDGVGEWTTTSIAIGKNNKIEILEELHFPHSLGLLYSAFTYYIGFKVNSGEYKIMGLAPYGKPKYKNLIKETLIDIKEDGSFKLNMEYFHYTKGRTMTSSKFNTLFGGKPRKKETEITQKEMDLACSIQEIIEEIILKITKHLKQKTGLSNLCLAGGVALNCVANSKILKAKIFDKVWIQPAAGDAGSALGTALSAYYQQHNKPRTIITPDSMKGTYLGPSYSNPETKKQLKKYQAKFHKYENFNELCEIVSKKIADGKIIGWHQGRMEFGPRALGARSIIGDARNKNMQKKLNLKVKYRESFRPFAPSVLEEAAHNYFDLNCNSPYMLFVAPIKKELQTKTSETQKKIFGLAKINYKRSSIPAVTHVDYSARIQTVNKKISPRYHQLIKTFQQKTGSAVIINTSFNVRGQPIVCTPEDSYRCFMNTEMDILVINDFLLYKKEQPSFDDANKGQEQFELD
jgi:carbamoyltransferase